MFEKATKYYLAIGAAIIFAVAGFFGLRSCDRKKDIANSSLVLLPTESERVIVDPRQHRITLVTKDHVKAFTLPDRPSVISVLKADGIKIVSPQYGTEFNPFLGAAYTLDGGKVLGGIDIFYYKKLDIALGLSIDPHLVQNTGPFLGFSYLAYSNCSIGLGLDNHVVPMLFVKVRL